MKTHTIVPLGLLAVLGWVFHFVCGLLMKSAPYREQLAEAKDPLSLSSASLALKCAFIYTPTNVAGLTMFAAFVGGCASRLLYSVEDYAHREGADRPGLQAPARSIFLLENPFSSSLRGFAVYLAFLAGIYITTDAPFSDPTQAQYARIGGLLSLIAFVVGYDPTLFRAIVRLAPTAPRP